VIFKQYSRVISIEQLIFQKTSNHSHNIYCPKTVKNDTD